VPQRRLPLDDQHDVDGRRRASSTSVDGRRRASSTSVDGRRRASTPVDGRRRARCEWALRYGRCKCFLPFHVRVFCRTSEIGVIQNC